MGKILIIKNADFSANATNTHNYIQLNKGGVQ